MHWKLLHNVVSFLPDVVYNYSQVSTIGVSKVKYIIIALDVAKRVLGIPNSRGMWDEVAEWLWTRTASMITCNLVVSGVILILGLGFLSSRSRSMKVVGVPVIALQQMGYPIVCWMRVWMSYSMPHLIWGSAMFGWIYVMWRVGFQVMPLHAYKHT